MLINLKDLTVEELTELIRQAKAEKLRKLKFGVLKQKKYKLVQNLKRRLSREVDNNFANKQEARKVKRAIFKGLNIPKTKREIGNMKMPDVWKLLKRTEKFQTSFDKRYQKQKPILIKKLSKYIPEAEAKKIITKAKNKTKALYKKNYFDVLNNAGEQELGGYARVLELYQEKKYPSQQQKFEDILRKKGFVFDKEGNANIDIQKIFEESIKDAIADEPLLEDLISEAELL